MCIVYVCIVYMCMYVYVYVCMYVCIQPNMTIVTYNCYMHVCMYVCTCDVCMHEDSPTESIATYNFSCMYVHVCKY